MAQNVWLVPTKPTMIEGRKVIKILCEPNGQDKHNQRERKRNMGKKNAKEVYCITNGKTYPSVSNCASALGISTSAVSKVCNGQLQSTAGYQFKFKGQ